MGYWNTVQFSPFYFLSAILSSIVEVHVSDLLSVRYFFLYREAICRVCEAAGLKTAKKRKVSSYLVYTYVNVIQIKF